MTSCQHSRWGRGLPKANACRSLREGGLQKDDAVHRRLILCVVNDDGEGVREFCQILTLADLGNG